jgi:two-component sensor histidine kinase
MADELVGAICDGARQAFANRIEIHAESEPRRLSNDAAQPLALILNELLSNAIKHGVGQKSHGKIEVGLQADGDDIVLTVEDNGPGFEPPQIRRQSSGLGLARGLAGQLGGNLTVTPGSGGRCTVRFPESRAR